MKIKMFAAVMAGLLTMGCVSAVTVSADAENKELVVGFDAEYPPF